MDHVLMARHGGRTWVGPLTGLGSAFGEQTQGAGPEVGAASLISSQP